MDGLTVVLIGLLSYLLGGLTVFGIGLWAANKTLKRDVLSEDGK